MLSNSDLSIHMCLSVHATWPHFTTRWVASNFPGLACPDPGGWTEVNPSAEDQAYLVKQTDQS